MQSNGHAACHAPPHLSARACTQQDNRWWHRRALAAHAPKYAHQGVPPVAHPAAPAISYHLILGLPPFRPLKKRRLRVPIHSTRTPLIRRRKRGKSRHPARPLGRAVPDDEKCQESHFRIMPCSGRRRSGKRNLGHGATGRPAPAQRHPRRKQPGRSAGQSQRHETGAVGSVPMPAVRESLCVFNFIFPLVLSE